MGGSDTFVIAIAFNFNVDMAKEDLTLYDIKPKYMKNYIRYYGEHFNKQLCDFAVSKMYKVTNGIKTKITPYTKEEVETILKKYNITIVNKQGYDHVYVANMCKADLLGSSIPNEQYLAKYIKDVLDDPDGYPCIAFYRWYADTCKKAVIIDWEDMI